MAATRSEVLRLYKQLLRESNGFTNYIFRTYSLRRVKDAFKENKNESDPGKIAERLDFGKKNLEIVKRQVIIGKLYRAPELVIESQMPSKQTVSSL